ncbi:MAG: glutaredoxin domain-containing protein [Gammaproteobacteria bacterium]
MAGHGAVTVYTAGFCGHCIRTLALLDRRGIPYREVSVEDRPGLREELLAKSGRRTLPQVYLGDRYIGGAEELAVMDKDGELSRLIQARNDDG